MKSLYVIILGLSLVFASCDNTTSTKKSSSSHAQTTEEEKKNGGGETSQAKTVYSFAFATKEHKVPYKARSSYMQEVKEENKPEGDERTISYSSSEPKIATVDETTGTVTFKTAGTITITAEKEADGEHEKVSDTYTLYITMKPSPTIDADGNSDFGKAELAKEIKRAMQAHGPRVDLNYIDTSAITDMKRLFCVDVRTTPKVTEGYGLDTFAGNISKWDVLAVTDMNSMFAGATVFNQNLDAWGSRLHTKIKERDWAHASLMFFRSGLGTLPNWCDAECQRKTT